jgi:lipid II:glycine glycyltransferase (peptidoglycan interpeptide bridge formation enzyme)
VTSRLSPDAWEAFLARHPDAHLLQSAAWGDLKTHYGWEPVRVAAGDAGAQILVRRLPFGLRLAYVPRGPVGGWLPSLMANLREAATQAGAFVLKVEPDAPDGESIEAELQRHGFQPSPHTVQPRRTLVVDLRGSEDELLARMHSKTRYNIRLAERRAVVVRPSKDLAAFSDLLRRTADRDEFSVHSPDYYRRSYDAFHPRVECELLIAEKDGRPLAGLMVFARGRRAWYFYGASADEDRSSMPTYLLQWEAMRWARGHGCESYDLWGVPDEPEALLEAEFTRRHDGLWGVYRFKRGFGGELRRTVGAWDFPLQPGIYAAYRILAGRLKGLA